MNDVDEDVSVDVEGVTLRKTLNDHQFETLAVVFDIRSGRESPAGVTIRDAIPDGVAAEDIGFHPEYGGDNWRAEGDEVVFSRIFAPGEQYTTVYGVRDFDEPRTALVAEPNVSVDATAIEGDVGGIDELVSEGDSDLVREVIAGERDALPGMGGGAEADGPGPVHTGDDLVESADADAGWGAEEPAEVDEGPEPAAADSGVAEEPAGGDDDWGEPADPAADIPTAEELAAEAGADDAVAEPVEAEDAVEPAPDEAPAEADPVQEPMAESMEEPADGVADEPVKAPADEPAAGGAADDEAITVPATGGVARVLAKELRAGNVSREDRRLLREELLPDEGSTDARIKRLQTQVADLAAYTDALEAFLDEEGGAAVILGELEDDIEAMADDVDDVEDSVGDVSDTVTDLSTDVESVEDEVAEVGEELRAVGDTTARLDDDVAELQSSVGELDDLDRRLGRVEDDVSAIMDQLEELAAFRDRLSSVFGSGGMGGGSMGGESGDDER